MADSLNRLSFVEDQYHMSSFPMPFSFTKGCSSYPTKLTILYATGTGFVAAIDFIRISWRPG